MPIIRPLPALALGASLALSAAHAEEPTVPAALARLQQQGVEVIKSFPAPAGLRGYVISAQGRPHVVYTSADGQHLLIGVMLDAEGRNLTEDQLREYAPKADLSKAWQSLEDARWVAEGAKNPEKVVYVLADPYCPYCHAFWLAAQPYEKVGLQVRWLWVSYLRPDGAAKAAAILEADDPTAAMERHERQFAQGGIAAALSPKPETLAAVRANTALMQKLGVGGTPAVFFKDPKGEVQVIQGMPKLHVLPGIFGLPEQPNDDPALARFR